MSFIRRWLGGPAGGEPRDERDPTPGEIEADERARDLELLRGEQSRLDDLRQRQLRYADRAWTPPVQGGERRADDADRNAAGEE
ncbi:MAG TPA: hypothetical protein VGK63_00595 [Candidatus Limnocylindrales bacterium]